MEATGTTDATAHAAVLDALGQVWDPELGIDVVTMGLIYGVTVSGDAVEVEMTLTTPGCPVSESLPAEAEAAVRAALPGHTVTVRVVWDPPWTPDRMATKDGMRVGIRRRKRRR